MCSYIYDQIYAIRYVRTLSWTYDLFRRVYESRTTDFLRTQQWWIGSLGDKSTVYAFRYASLIV